MSITAVARVSLGFGGPPVTRTAHTIVVRARKVSGAGTVTLRSALYEGVTNRSGDLESTALTTSLATYTLAISDASAAAISSYADLELRFWGFSSTNDIVNVEVADISLQTPVPAWVQTIPDALAITDSNARVQGIGRSLTIADSLGVTDARTTLRDGRGTIADNLAFTDARTPILTIGIPVADNPSFDTNIASWSLPNSGSGSIARLTSGVDTAPGALSWTPAGATDIAGHYLQETFSGTFRAGVEYTLSLRTSGTGAGAVGRFQFGDLILGDFADTGIATIGAAGGYFTTTISWTPATDTSQVTLRMGDNIGNASYFIDTLILTAGHDPNIVRSLAPEALALADAVVDTEAYVRTINDTLAITDANAGTTAPTGTTTTPVARLSLAAGGAPTSRANHEIIVRARKVSGTGTVVINAALYEGPTNRSGDLQSTSLTTSLADYVLAIADADAALITNYLDLELRVWAVSTTGDTVNVEIADVSLSTPAAGPTSYAKVLTEALGVTDSPTPVGGLRQVIANTLNITETVNGVPTGGVLHSYRTEAGGFMPIFALKPGARVSGKGTTFAVGHQTITGGTSWSQGINDALAATDGRAFLSSHLQVLADSTAITDAIINQNTMIVALVEQLALIDAFSDASAAAILIPDNLSATDGIDALFAPGGTIFNQSLAEALGIADTFFIPNIQHVQPISDFIAMQGVLAYRRSLHIPDIFIVGDQWTFHGTAFVSIIDLVYPLRATVEAVPSLLATIQAANVMLLMPDIQFKLIDADQQYADMSVEQIATKLATIEDYVRG